MIVHTYWDLLGPTDVCGWVKFLLHTQQMPLKLLNWSFLQQRIMSFKSQKTSKKRNLNCDGNSNFSWILISFSLAAFTFWKKHLVVQFATFKALMWNNHTVNCCCWHWDSGLCNSSWNKYNTTAALSLFGSSKWPIKTSDPYLRVTMLAILLFSYIPLRCISKICVCNLHVKTKQICDSHNV